VLDDAFQHIQLKRDIDLVLLDHIRPFGNTHLLPRGVLREPPSALARSAACILTRCRAGTEENALTSLARIQMLVPDIPVFSSSHVPYWYVVQKGKHPSFEAVPEIFSAKDVGPLKLSKVFCFSGIGRNDHFRQTVRDLGFMAAGSLEFLDHHQYTEKDRVTILRCAADAGADRLITTEKDYARIASKAAFPLELIVIGVKVSFGDSTRDFGAFIHNRLSLAMA
jgi:tetraacyldisaccharide 4'-kinase